MNLKNLRLKLATTLAFAALALGTAVPKASASGIIVPAYLSLADTADWTILKEGAATAAAGTSTVYTDYWVVVNGPANGPFTTAADWATAATVWDPIVVNGGQVFGYVNTNETPTNHRFRSLAAVENDIDAWVNGYANLGGIWIDEFYPRYEIADTDVNGVDTLFPNGQIFAPTDQSFIQNGAINTSVQVNPAGGYYSQLTAYIRATYPGLKIIGNAGGRFYSNQAQYASLCDVTCSFEQTYAVAANAPTNDWASLNLLPLTESYAQLSLIHANSSDLNGAINQSISHGYKYFYTTNRLLNNNIWGGLPPYFSSEVSFIANHP